MLTSFSTGMVNAGFSDLPLFADSTRTYLLFHSPLWLLLIIPISIMGWLKCYPRRTAAISFSCLGLFRSLPTTWAQRLRPVAQACIWAGLILAIVAMARPQKGVESYRIHSEGIAMAICLDRSGSMGAPDFNTNGRNIERFTAVKDIFKDFVCGDDKFEGRPNDLIALIAFGGFVDTACPLTLDHEALTEALDMIDTPSTSGGLDGATAIGDALIAGIGHVRKSKARSKVIILLSDGGQNAGAVLPEEAAQAAKRLGIRIYTIGIGTSSDNFFWHTEFDADTLKRVAKITNGEFFMANNSHALRKVCKSIDSLEKTINEGGTFTKYHEYYRGFLVPGLFLMFLGLALITTRCSALPD